VEKGWDFFCCLLFIVIGSDMIAPKLGSSGYMVENTYLQPVVSGALYVGGKYLFSMQSQGVFYPFLFQIGAQSLGSYLSPPLC